MTYWDKHELEGTIYPGSGRLGCAPGDNNGRPGTHPIENEQADKIAQALGMAVRDPADDRDHGSTFLLIEPTVLHKDVLSAIERYWWPALEERPLGFEAVVEDAAGVVHIPRPRQNKDLRPFISAYEIATTPQDVQRHEVLRRELQRIGDFEKPGVLALVADQADWSHPEYSEGETAIDHRNLVALMRDPRMVVEYYSYGRVAPFVRGVFVADPSTNDPLRLTEPKAHDSWQTVSSSDVPEGATDLARQLANRIKSGINNLRNRLKPPPKPASETQFLEFDRIMRLVMRGTAGGGRTAPFNEERPVSIHPGGALELQPDGRLCIEGAARVALSEHHQAGNDGDAQAEVCIIYKFMEGERAGEQADLLIEPPQEFLPIPGRTNAFRGTLRHDEPVEFEYWSNPYDPNWTGRLSVTADVMPSGDENEEVSS